MPHHPECQPDETFVGNTSKQDFVHLRLDKLEGVRLGTTAYDIYGEGLPEAYAPYSSNTRPLLRITSRWPNPSRLKKGLTCFR